jgi:hypothetical protein
MKSTFLFLVILGTLVSSQAFGRNKNPIPKPLKVKKSAVSAPAKPQAVTTLAPTSAQPAEAPKSSFDKFYERLSIGYFGAVTSPNLETWDSRRGAISPEFSGKTNNDSYPMNIWSQVNFGYNFGGKFKFNVIPRFTTFFDKAPDQGPGERGMVILEDALVGFSGVLYSSDDKKFNWWFRPGIRLPTSYNTRATNDASFGRLTYNIELLSVFSYDFNSKWQLALTSQDRYWIFENRYNASRNRFITIPYVTYTLNDTTKIQVYYEHFLENNKRLKSINGKNPSYRNVWQNAYIGIAKDITPKLNVFPYISAFVNDVPFSTQSVWLGLWVSYQIK